MWCYCASRPKDNFHPANAFVCILHDYVCLRYRLTFFFIYNCRCSDQLSCIFTNFNGPKFTLGLKLNERVNPLMALKELELVTAKLVPN